MATPTGAPTAVPVATATPETTLTPIGDLAGLIDQETTVQGSVVWASSFSAGFKFLLDDGTGQVALLMWLNVYDDCWDAPDLMVGATVRAHGTVGEYEGELQLEAGYGGDVKVVTPGTPPPLREIGSLTVDDLTTRVTVEGTVVKVEAFSSGQRVFVADSSGSMLVLLWQNVFERVPDNARLLAAGTAVRVSGVVEEYQDTLELVPQLPYSVVVLPQP
jgi:RecJ-like exonuclease